MRALRSCAVVAVCLAGLLMATAAQAQTLRLGGTGSALGLLQQVGAEFSNAAEIKIDIVPALGSTGAIRALADGVLDIAVSARPLKADEATAGLSQVTVLRTAFVLATSHPKPNGLRRDELAAIYAANEWKWADGTPIRLILRPRSETDTTLLGKLFPGMSEAIETARRRPDVPTAATDQDNVERAEHVPGSLIATTTAQLTTEHRHLRIVPLDGVVPSLATFESGAYPFTKRFYFVVRSNSRPEARQFIDFLRSPPGIKALREAETLPERE